jgi:putative transposase
MLGVERMCHLAVVSRASYYRHWEEVAPDEAEMAARVSIQEVVLRHRRRYGYRRVTVDLHRQGMVINHKRVARIMREAGSPLGAAGDSLPQVHSHDGFQA